MVQKVGRNDPCPCGSGKKYKNCHMLIEEQERKAAKYTTSGKRKFKASVIKLDSQALHVFNSSRAGLVAQPIAPEKLKFNMTELDFRVPYDSHVSDLLTPFLVDTGVPQPSKGFRRPEEVFQMVTEDFRLV